MFQVGTGEFEKEQEAEGNGAGPSNSTKSHLVGIKNGSNFDSSLVLAWNESHLSNEVYF